MRMRISILHYFLNLNCLANWNKFSLDSGGRQRAFSSLSFNHNKASLDGLGGPFFVPKFGPHLLATSTWYPYFFVSKVLYELLRMKILCID